MLKKVNHVISKRKKSELNVTPGENVRDAIVRAGIQAAEESAYAAGN